MKSKQAEAINARHEEVEEWPRQTLSDSTEPLEEGRSGVATESPIDREVTLEDLLSGVTTENLHSEVNFGAPIGKEKC